MKLEQEIDERETSEVVEFDVCLSTISVELRIGRMKMNGLREKFNGQFKVVLDKSLFGFLFKIETHQRQE